MKTEPRIIASVKTPNNGTTVGRRGLPAADVQVMYEDYLRLRSLAKTGKLHGDRSRSAMFSLFKDRGLKLYPRNFKKPRRFAGRRFTPGKNGYLRDTIFREKNPPGEVLLHRRIWIQHHGPIPPGHKICFKDGDRTNCRIGNLFKLTHKEQQQQRGAKGENASTKTASARLALMLAGKGHAVAQLKAA